MCIPNVVKMLESHTYTIYFSTSIQLFLKKLETIKNYFDVE